MNEFIAELTNNFSLNTIVERSQFEIASILAPSVILIIILFGFSFFLKKGKWRTAAYIICLFLALVFLPYELIRQSSEMSKADANVNEIHANLKNLLHVSNLDHLKNLVDKEVASYMLEESIDDLDKKQKKDIFLISWLMSENAKQSLHHFDDKQNSLADELKSDLNKTKAEIIDSREPVGKISDDILLRLEEDITHLIESRMKSFNEGIDSSLGAFQKEINSFVQHELKEYQQRLTSITQKNADELKKYTNEAKYAFTHQVNQSTKESLEKLDDIQKSIHNMETAIESNNLKRVTAQVEKLSASLDLIQKKNDILFEYSECLRSAGLIDFAGKEAQCKKKLSQGMDNLINE